MICEFLWLTGRAFDLDTSMWSIVPLDPTSDIIPVPFATATTSLSGNQLLALTGGALLAGGEVVNFLNFTTLGGFTSRGMWAWSILSYALNTAFSLPVVPYGYAHYHLL
jgi:hypothetical protein